MPKQPIIPGLQDAIKKKVTRREQFLAEINAVVFRKRLQALIEPHYPKAGLKGQTDLCGDRSIVETFCGAAANATN